MTREQIVSAIGRVADRIPDLFSDGCAVLVSAAEVARAAGTTEADVRAAGEALCFAAIGRHFVTEFDPRGVFAVARMH